MLQERTLTPVEIRARLHDAVIRDLLGPAGGPEEIVDEQNVRGRYSLGLLAPKGQTPLPSDPLSGVITDDDSEAAPEENDDLAVAGNDTEDGRADAPAPKAATMLPQSIGLTFTVVNSATALQVTARWGRYERVDREKVGLEPARRNAWQRKPVEAMSAPIPLKPGRLARWSPDPTHPGVYVDGLIRKYGHGWTVTLYLVNGQREQKRNKDEAWVFQPELTVTSTDGQPVFQCHLARSQDLSRLTPEEQSMRMLYRKQVEFAVGHGVAVHADVSEGHFDCATRLRTEVVPAYELWPTRPTAVEGVQLDMLKLAEMDDASFASALQPLLDAYGAWIAGLEGVVTDPPPDLAPHSAAAHMSIDHCKHTLQRMREGIELLGHNPQAAQAFRFANRAMYLQRLHTLYTRKVRTEQYDKPIEDFKPDRPVTWFPFQLAFILLNLPSLTDPLHPDRDGIADVLWFPTGGGKTEAYLGLTAYTLGLRRLQGTVGDYDGGAGVAVLMRYTLRLLTLQQFQRATALICACESIRRANVATWGREPFRIGLWVGQRSTPNWTEDSAEIVKDIRRGSQYNRGGTPHQLTFCPWCGRAIHPGQDIEVDPYEQGSCRTLIYCSDPLGHCLFSRKQSPGEGLPVLVVDEEIYRRLPALLIATVDKFAQMPWKGETQMLFGRVNGYCPRHGYRSPELKDSDSHQKTRDGKMPAVKSVPRGPLRPPDLIIQDELHLINGPLGTLVGLYETAVDALSAWTYQDRTVHPKVIASSATIRKAKELVSALYTRQAQVFPPSGLDARDSFFARQFEPAPDAPGRLYVGICAPGSRTRALLIRAYVAYMAAAQQLYENEGGSVDPWMTLVGYFNSMRELGGMRRATEDAVRSRLTQMDQRGLARRKLNPLGIEELTSRRGAAEIPKILDRLETTFDPERDRQRREQRKAGERPPASELPVDVLLATNMISVGVDVSRLGLMVVASQPKNTAEYIQATSRIGRAFPGLVCTTYNWTRPRDLSHYERFEHYHATFYQQVEGLSVTPFSPRALDRGLAAVLVSQIRLAEERYNANDTAGQLQRDDPRVVEALADISRRAGRVNEDAQDGEAVRQRLEMLLDDWLHLAARLREGAAQLGYETRRDGNTRGLLQKPNSRGTPDNYRFTCLNSLRDVEPNITLVLHDHD
jgi:hypothetical protein